MRFGDGVSPPHPEVIQLLFQKLDDSFSVQELVLQLRKQRPAMVQSLDQYALVYRAIAEIFRRRLDLIDSHDYVNWPTDVCTVLEVLLL